MRPKLPRMRMRMRMRPKLYKHTAHASLSFRLSWWPCDSDCTSSKHVLSCTAPALTLKPWTLKAMQAVEFFETSALLITFIALGKLLEGAAKGRTSRVRM
jgi:hypothetical protein